jgi:hypothetical protein
MIVIVGVVVMLAASDTAFMVVAEAVVFIMVVAAMVIAMPAAVMIISCGHCYCHWHVGSGYHSNHCCNSGDHYHNGSIIMVVVMAEPCYSAHKFLNNSIH